MTYIGGGWYMKKSAKGLPPLRRTRISKKSQEKQDEMKKAIFVGIQIFTTFGKTDLIKDKWRTTYARQTA